MASEASMEIPMIVEDVERQSGRVHKNASEKPNSSNSRAKILPRYLRASPGSCHDFCKYGRKHAMEVKERIPIRKFLKARRAEQAIQASVSAERNLKVTGNSIPLKDSETKKHDDPDTRKKDASLSSKNEAMPSEEDLSGVEGLTDVSVEDLDNRNSKPKQCSLAGQEIFETKECKVSEVGLKTRRKTRSKEVGTSVLGERKTVVRPSLRLSPKRSLSKVSNVAIRNSTKSLNGDSHPKSQNKVVNIEAEQAINEDVPEKTLYVIESTIENTTLEPTQDDAQTTAQSSQSSLVTAHFPPPFSRKNSRPNGSRVHATRSPPSVSLGKKGIRNMKPVANSKKSESSLLQPLSPSSLVSPSDSKENGVSSLDQSKATEKKKKKKIVNSKVESKKTVNAKFERKNSGGRRSGILISESKSIPAQKLKFRRGTILDLKTENSDTPRRLKFRRVKFIGENQNGKDHNQRACISRKEVSTAECKVGTKTKPEKLISRIQNPKSITSGATRRSLRRNEIGVGEGELVGAKMNSEKVVLRHPSADATTIARRSFKRSKTVCGDLITKTSSEKVVLRHQNVAEKKEVQSLFNNVIEETASKLVEARKSKVKALVGAFETVISLQDARPSATAGGT